MYNTVVKNTTAGYASIDGFISDTANYTPTQEPLLTNPTLQVGGQNVDSATFYQFNPTFDELSYDTAMYNTLVSAGFPSSKEVPDRHLAQRLGSDPPDDDHLGVGRQHLRQRQQDRQAAVPR